MTYDANGNRLTKRGAGSAETIVWDGENRPTQITVGALANLYVYAPDGSRLKKRIPNGLGGFQETLTLGADLERSPAGVWTKYLHADVKRVGNGGAAQPFYHHRDHLASIRVITSGAGGKFGRISLAQGVASAWRLPGALIRLPALNTRSSGIAAAH